jgi:hypothetical protein
MEKILLKQKRLFSRREFELTDKVVKVRTSSLKENLEYIVKLENLGNQVTYHSDNMIIKNVIVSIFALVPIALVLGYFFASDPPDDKTVLANLVIWIPLTIGLGLIKGKKDTHIVGGAQSLTLYQDIPTKETVDKFVANVIERTRKTVRNKYFKVDSDLPEETQMNIYNWLVNSEFISEQEYQEIKEEYKNRRLM